VLKNIQASLKKLLCVSKYNTSHFVYVVKVSNMLLSGRSLCNNVLGVDESQLRPTADNHPNLWASCDPQNKTLLCQQTL